MPPAASVEYADAISSGVTPIVPRVIDGTACVFGSFSEVRMPRRCAMRKMLIGPTSSASRAYTVLSDWYVARATDSTPEYVCSYVWTHQAIWFSHVPDGSGLYMSGAERYDVL